MTLTRRQFATQAFQCAFSTMSIDAFAGEGRNNSWKRFSESLAAFGRRESLVLSVQRDRADRIEEENAFPQGRALTRARPSDRPISQNATSLIISSEVSGKATYTSKYQSPTWPGDLSGVTIGIGYDLGFVTKQYLHEDWDDYIGSVKTKALEASCGIRGMNAGQLLRSTSDIRVSWEIARRQYKGAMEPRYVGETMRALPNCELLTPDSLGALVALVYNRGPTGFIVPASRDTHNRFSEMRKIKALMSTMCFAEIPSQIRQMARLWRSDPHAQGLVFRRQLEADLFELGLS